MPKISDAELRYLKAEGRHLEAAFQRFLRDARINYDRLTAEEFEVLRAVFMAGVDHALSEFDDFLDSRAEPVANAMAMELQACDLSFHAREPRRPRVVGHA